MLRLFEDEPLAVEAIGAIRAGDLDALRHLLAEKPGLADATITRRAPGDRQPFSYPLVGAVSTGLATFRMLPRRSPRL